jgi:hypothetical protein
MSDLVALTTEQRLKMRQDYQDGYADAWDNGAPRKPDNVDYMAGYKAGSEEYEPYDELLE